MASTLVVHPFSDPDIYSKEYQHPLWLPKGHLRRLTKGPCYDPNKGEEGMSPRSVSGGA